MHYIALFRKNGSGVKRGVTKPFLKRRCFRKQIPEAKQTAQLSGRGFADLVNTGEAMSLSVQSVRPLLARYQIPTDQTRGGKS